MAPFVAAAGALFFGFFIVRLTQTYFAMLSLAFAQIVFTVDLQVEDPHRRRRRHPERLAAAAAQVTPRLLLLHARGGRAGDARPATPSSTRPSATRSGRFARTRGAPASSASNVRRHQLFAFVLSGFFSGLAGGLFAFFNGSVFPDFAYLNKSFEPLVVALLGGIQSFFGPLAGAVGFKILETLIARQWPVYWPLFLGSAVDPGHRGAAAGLRRAPPEAVMADPNGALVLQTVGLRKHFGGVQAVNGVDLAVPAGDLRAIIGPNGAGKTTLFNLITGDLPHDSGQIFFRGAEVSGLPPQALCRRGLARTFQVTSIFRRLTRARERADGAPDSSPAALTTSFDRRGGSTATRR